MKMKKLVKKIVEYFNTSSRDRESDKIAVKQRELKEKLDQKIVSKREKLEATTDKKEAKELKQEIKVLEKLDQKLQDF